MTTTLGDRPLEVGLIGYGLGGATFHAPFIATTPGLHLSAVMTGDRARRSAAEQRYSGVRVAGDLDALLGGSPKVDVVAISTPNATHFPLACAALEAGRHVVVDKPFAATPVQAREVADLAARVGKLAIPFQNRRWDGDFLTLKQIISDNSIGDVRRFESRFDRWRPTPKPGWCRTDAAEKAEGIVYDIGTHLIDQALQLFGPVTYLYAELDWRHPDVVTEDTAFITLAHEGGVHSHLHMSTSAGLPGPRMSVFGTRGAYMKHGLDVQEDALRAGATPGGAGWGEEPEERWGSLGAGDKVEPVRTLPGNYPAFYAGVERAIRNGSPPPVTIAEVEAGLQIIEAVFRSARDAKVVKVTRAE
jgi:predicted dehydrogenase